MEATVIAREDTPNSDEFFFVHSGEVSRGAFLEYNGEDGDIICRVSDVFKSNEYFENPEGVESSDVGGSLPVDEWEVSMGKAEIMGRFSEGMISRVTQAPAPGIELEEADEARVEKFLGLEDDGLEIGKVQQQDINAEIGLTDTLQKHFAILAQSGAGKSYTSAVMLEEIIEKEHSPAVIAVDPHGDYTCFAEDKNYMKDVKVFTDRNISIAVNDLSADQIDAYFDLSSPQRRELAKIIDSLKNSENTDYGLEDLREQVEQRDINSKTRYVLLDTLREMRSMKVFGETNSPSRNDVEPGQLNIIDLSETINHRKKQIITAFFGRHFFRLRRKKSVPPFLLLVEEAHNFAPEKSPSPSRTVLEKIAREGRKFHASLGLISQRPVRLSTTALSQCNTKFILRVTNPNDLEHIAQSSEGITADVKNSIPGLKTGEAIVMGEAVNYPTFIDVRERRSKESESGEGLENALEEWIEEDEKRKTDAEAFM